MNKQEWQYALQPDFISVCLVICTALLLASIPTAVISLLSIGRYGHPFVLLPVFRTSFACWNDFLAQAEGRHTHLLAQHRSLTPAQAVGGSKDQGCWPGSSPGAPRCYHLFCYRQVTVPSFLLSDHKLVSCRWTCCWLQWYPEPEDLTDSKDKLLGVTLEKTQISWTASSSSSLQLLCKAVGSFQT